MQTTFAHIEELVTNSGKLAETKAEIFALKTTRKASVAVSEVVTRLSFLLVLIFMLLMLSFGAAYWVGGLLESMTAGFLTVAGFYTLVGLLLFAFKKEAIATPVQNYFIKKALG